MPYRLIGKSPKIHVSSAHIHDEWEIVLNLEGEGLTEIGETAFAFKAGTVACIPPHTPHTKQAKDGFVDMFLCLPTFPAPKAVRVFEDDEHRIEQVMTLIHSIYHRREANYRAITDHLMQALEQMLLDKEQMTAVDPRVARIADMAVDRFTDPDFSIASAMADCGYCEDHLRRLFRKQFGESPLEYLTTLRINYAKRLLRESGRMHHSVTEIAAMVGFTDVCYFSRIFKKRVGVSPRAYMNPSACESRI